MKQIGYMRKRKDLGLFVPEDGDRIALSNEGMGYDLSTYSGGKLTHQTDKVNYPSLGGVTFLGGLSDEPAAFVIDPRWVAANILAVRKLFLETERRVEWRLNATYLKPVLDLSKAIKIIQREVREYCWMPEYNTWGVPGYKFGPERWVFESIEETRRTPSTRRRI